MGEYLMTSLNDEFWDRDEYEYFCKLSDEDKLEYAIALFQLDDIDMANEIVTKEKMLDYYDGMEIFIENNTMSIKAAQSDMIDEFMVKFIMDGNIVDRIDVKKNNRKYRVLGTTPPISIN